MERIIKKMSLRGNPVMNLRIHLNFPLTKILMASFIVLLNFNLNSQSLDSLIAEAVANNPQLKALQYKVKASEFRAESVNNYPAPNVSLEFSQVPINDVNILNQAISNNLAVSQMFPLGDKLGAMTEVEKRNAKVEGDSYTAYKVNLTGQIKMSYYTLWLVDRKTDVQIKSIAFLKDLIKSMETTFSINRTSQADVLSIESEIASSETQLL
ncbi:MAG: TolC family protein, partial [Ignavibacteriales bacterium]|nr:TolC family protein [Ignavibacteriales bacterium]